MLLFCAMVIGWHLQLSAAQFGMPGMGMEQPKAAAVKSDVQYIKCQACEALVKQAYRHTKSQREGLKPHQKVGPSRTARAVLCCILQHCVLA